MAEVSLDGFQELLRAEYNASSEIRRLEKQVAELKKIREQVRDVLSQRMGSAETGTVNGAEVIKRTVSKQFAEAKFREKYPQHWEECKVPKLVYETDVNKLKEIDEAIVAEFSTVRWTNSFEER